MKNYPFYILFISLFVSLASCNESMPDTRKYKDEFKDRTVMRVTEGQLTEFAMKKGDLIADSLERIVSNKKELNSFIDSLEILYGIKTSLVDKNNVDTTTKEGELMSAYAYNVSQKLPCEDNIQKISNEDLLFTRAILQKDSLWGIWALKMPKKELIKRITLKDIKK